MFQKETKLLFSAPTLMSLINYGNNSDSAENKTKKDSMIENNMCLDMRIQRECNVAISEYNYDLNDYEFELELPKECQLSSSDKGLESIIFNESLNSNDLHNLEIVTDIIAPKKMVSFDLSKNEICLVEKSFYFDDFPNYEADDEFIESSFISKNPKNNSDLNILKNVVVKEENLKNIDSSINKKEELSNTSDSINKNTNIKENSVLEAMKMKEEINKKIELSNTSDSTNKNINIKENSVIEAMKMKEELIMSNTSKNSKLKENSVLEEEINKKKELSNSTNKNKNKNTKLKENSVLEEIKIKEKLKDINLSNLQNGLTNMILPSKSNPIRKIVNKIKEEAIRSANVVIKSNEEKLNSKHENNKTEKKEENSNIENHSALKTQPKINSKDTLHEDYGKTKELNILESDKKNINIGKDKLNDKDKTDKENLENNKADEKSKSIIDVETMEKKRINAEYNLCQTKSSVIKNNDLDSLNKKTTISQVIEKPKDIQANTKCLKQDNCSEINGTNNLKLNKSNILQSDSSKKSKSVFKDFFSNLSIHKEPEKACDESIDRSLSDKNISISFPTIKNNPFILRDRMNNK